MHRPAAKLQHVSYAVVAVLHNAEESHVHAWPQRAKRWHRPTSTFCSPLIALASQRDERPEIAD